MNVEIGTETPIFLFWEYLFRNFGILSLQCIGLPFYCSFVREVAITWMHIWDQFKTYVWANSLVFFFSMTAAACFLPLPSLSPPQKKKKSPNFTIGNKGENWQQGGKLASRMDAYNLNNFVITCFAAFGNRAKSDCTFFSLYFIYQANFWRMKGLTMRIF